MILNTDGTTNFEFLTENVELFDIDRTTGILTVKGPIDREGIPHCKEGRDLCEMSLDVVIQPATHFHVIRIEILDVNDNRPTFAHATFQLNVSESTTMGAKFTLPRAVDLDGPHAGISKMTSSTPTAYFHLITETQIDNHIEIFFQLIRQLDREEKEEHHMILSAIDGGKPEMVGTMRLVVVVLDANDNKPIFEKPKYEITVFEDVPVGTTILKVSATDMDTGDNSKISYTISSQSPSLIGHLFTLQPITGNLVVKADLDREQLPAYLEFAVEAKDHGYERFTSTALVVVKIDDVNDNAPIVNNNLLFNVTENSPVNTFVGHVKVSDPDYAANGRVKCWLVEVLKFQMVENFNAEYTISTCGLIDRELVEEYNLVFDNFRFKIFAVDGGKPPLTGTAYVHITVIDVDDNRPKFLQTSYTFSVPENVAVSESVGSVSANDQLQFHQSSFHQTPPLLESSSFKKSSKRHFSLNTETGQITVKRRLDREETSTHRLTVVAFNPASPRWSGSTIVTINVLDVNDNHPKFLFPDFFNNSVVIDVDENFADSSVFVAKVVAVDADDGDSGKIAFDL
ncbi:hypothetical protein HELRODRAFT_71274, partial [Helobdella robusta]|uniref:Cadherin domain-containing protein n=1 Tax=Helobdella robusta TaxID=6412 RepID=T1G0I8_HELRO